MRWKLSGTLLLLLITTVTRAQLCQGSLGDPIVNITFGSGANPGPPLTAAATTYQYVASDCPNDGFYTVRNRTDQCFGNSWYSIPADHTGDPNGYFMLVNASYQPGAFYLDTVRGLCGGTTYEFAAWIMNVILPSSCGSNSIQPDLTFRIEQTNGTILQTYNTGSIAPPSSINWKQYGFFFTTPAGVNDIVLRILNNAPGGCGNDIALDDITFRPCGPQLTPSITGLGSTTATLCEGSGGNFTFNCAVSGGFNNPVFQWQSRTNNGPWFDIALATQTTVSGFILPSAPVGAYQFRLLVAEAGNMGSPQCRIASQPITVNVVANPVTTAASNGPVCEKNTLVLTAGGGTQYTWTGPNGYSSTTNPAQLNNIQLNQAGKYYVLVKNDAGCSKLDSTIVVVNTAPVVTTGFTTANICKGDSIQLAASGGPSYNWVPATGLSGTTIANPKASPSFNTIYRVIVTNTAGCKDSAAISINVTDLPVVDAGPDQAMFRGRNLQLDGKGSGAGYVFSWSPAQYISDVNILNPVINPPSDIQYILTAVSVTGCKNVSDTMLVKVYRDLYIPNAFSPNGDGLNDTWNIPALSAMPGFELFVYNRYGTLIFQTKKQPVAWDGTYKGAACNIGVYTYVIKPADGKEPIMGTVMLIR